MKPPAQTPNASADMPRVLHQLYRRTYPLRVLGMALGIVPVMVVLYELRAGWLVWTWVLLLGLVWPHIARWLAGRSRDPYRSERHNLMIDSLLVGSLLPLMHFNLLPSTLLMVIATADRLSTGVRGLWLRSLGASVLAMLVFIPLTGLHFQPQASVAVILACLPVLAIHTLTASATSYRLIRKVRSRNLQLDQMRRHDSLTGLQSRDYWEEMASMQLQRQRSGESATLMLVDVDSFKTINDSFGHAVGDDFLRHVADCMRAELPPDSHAGRLGGDEFAIVVPQPPAAVLAVAEAMRARVETSRLASAPRLAGSISIGVAAPPPECPSLRAWREHTDHALYQAKIAGRNRIHVARAPHDEPPRQAAQRAASAPVAD